MNTRLGRLSLLSLAALIFLFAPIHAQQDTALGQDTQRSPKLHRKGGRAVPNQYIVVLDQDAAGVAGDVAASERRAAAMLQPLARAATYVYGHAIDGFSAQLTEEEARQLSEDPRVCCSSRKIPSWKRSRRRRARRGVSIESTSGRCR